MRWYGSLPSIRTCSVECRRHWKQLWPVLAVSAVSKTLHGEHEELCRSLHLLLLQCRILEVLDCMQPRMGRVRASFTIISVLDQTLVGAFELTSERPSLYSVRAATYGFLGHPLGPPALFH
jgi:hypothetical protein